MIFKGDEKDTDLVNLKVLVYGICSKRVPACNISAIFYKFETSRNQLFEAGIIVLIFVDLDQVPLECCSLVIVSWILILRLSRV